jgi:hypothetical protein
MAGLVSSALLQHCLYRRTSQTRLASPSWFQSRCGPSVGGRGKQAWLSCVVLQFADYIRHECVSTILCQTEQWGGRDENLFCLENDMS